MAPSSHLATASSSLAQFLPCLFTELGCIHIDTSPSASPSTSPSSGYSKHEFACIPMTAVHINTSPSASPFSCDFYSYE